MTRLRIGTRGSDLALVQTRLVGALLKAADASLVIEEIVIKTHGDQAKDQPFDIHWPAGGFVSAIEQALLRGDIDVAVHSYKDLPTAATPDLVVVAVPPREAAHDVLVSRFPVSLAEGQPGMRIGTSSPRRAAQLRHFFPGARVMPVRGNVPTRLAKVSAGELDGVVLAAAGLNRLGLHPTHATILPIHQFVPAPGQGALAVQIRTGSGFRELIASIDDGASRLAVDAERAFLAATGAGCHTAAAAYGTVRRDQISLHGQLFSSDGLQMAGGVESGHEPSVLGRALADCLARKLLGK